MKHQHLFSYVERMNFPYLGALKFHSLTPLVHVLSSISALLKPPRSPLPSQNIHVIKCLHHNIDSQNLIFPIALWTYWCVSSIQISLKFPHSSLTPLLPFLHKLFFFTYLSYLFSPPLKLPRRIVPPLMTEGTCLPIPCTLNHSFISVLDTSSQFPPHNWA